MLPSGPSLLVGLALLALGVGSYGLARASPLFAIERIEVVGGPPAVRGRVATALAPLRGDSLVGLRRDELDRRLAALPDVAGASYDRAFPNTLRVFVLAERPLAVLRRGADSWLVSARGRVLRPLAKGARPSLPRVWIGQSVDVAPGDTLADESALRAVRVLSLASAELPSRIRLPRVEGDETVLVLRSGLEIRLGREHELRLKLAVAARILPTLGTDTAYLDVAVPERPVAGSNTPSQLELQLSAP